MPNIYNLKRNSACDESSHSNQLQVSEGVLEQKDLDILENVYCKTRFPSQKLFKELALQTQKDIDFLREWFQNRRKLPPLQFFTSYDKSTDCEIYAEVLTGIQPSKDVAKIIGENSISGRYILERFYKHTPRPNPDDIERLAKEMKSNSGDVYNWFYNKRKKDTLDNIKASSRNLTKVEERAIDDYFKHTPEPTKYEIENLSILHNASVQSIRSRLLHNRKINSTNFFKNLAIKKTKNPQQFSSEQVIVLKTLYSHTPFPKRQEIDNLAQQFEKDSNCLFSWFEQQRATELSEEMQQIEVPHSPEILLDKELSDNEVTSYLKIFAKKRPCPSNDELEQLATHLGGDAICIKEWFKCNVQIANSMIHKRKIATLRKGKRKPSSIFKCNTGNKKITKNSKYFDDQSFQAYINIKGKKERKGKLNIDQITNKRLNTKLNKRYDIKPCVIKLYRCDQISDRMAQRVCKYIQANALTATDDNIALLCNKFGLSKDVIKTCILKWQNVVIERDNIVQEEAILNYSTVTIHNSSSVYRELFQKMNKDYLKKEILVMDIGIKQENPDLCTNTNTEIWNIGPEQQMDPVMQSAIIKEYPSSNNVKIEQTNFINVVAELCQKTGIWVYK